MAHGIRRGGAQVIGTVTRVTGLALAGAAGAWLTGALTGLEPLALGVGPVLLYNRLNRGATLDNDTRRRIFEFVQGMPGACIADVATEVGVSHSTASYHLDKLCGFDLLTSTTDGNKVRFFMNGGAFTEEERRVLSVLDNAETRRVLVTILLHPWSYRAELTLLLDVSSPTVNWHLERLTSAGLVTEHRSGRNRHLFADATRIADVLRALRGKLATTHYDAQGLTDILDVCARVPGPPAVNGPSGAVEFS